MAPTKDTVEAKAFNSIEGTKKKKGSALPVFDNGKTPHKFSQEERKSTPFF
jgi:hypothetical protein